MLGFWVNMNLGGTVPQRIGEQRRGGPAEPLGHPAVSVSRPQDACVCVSLCGTPRDKYHQHQLTVGFT